MSAGPRSNARRWLLAGGALALATALLVPAAADWLVTREGDRIETAGPWRVENRLVVFERPDGTYASMRLSEVDLEASERLTRELAEEARAPEPEPEPRPVVARLTEKELPPAGRRPPPEGEPAPDDGGGDDAPEADGEAPEGEEAAPAPESLQIVGWREVGGAESSGIELVGDVRNVTGGTALDVRVTVVLLDEEGEAIESTDALLTTSALPPGGTAGFRASFPGIFHFAGIDFRPSGELVLSGEEEGGGEEQDQQTDVEEPPD